MSAAGAAHPDVVRLVTRFEAAGVRPYAEMSVLEARAVLERVVALQAPPMPVAHVGDVLVPGAAGLIPARVYHPDPGRKLPVVVYIHGGGWVLGGVEVADRPCRRLAVESGCAVVSLEYRRAPETKFPGPLQDCISAIRWLARHADEVGGDPQRLVVMGDSAGGNLAAGAAICLRDEGGPSIVAQVLLYPCLSPARATTFASYRDFADGPLMTRGDMEWFWAHYLGTMADETDPRAAPLAAVDLSGLPPALLVVAELDPLRDEGLAYAERLGAAGVAVETAVFTGAAHGFWWMDGVMQQAEELTRLLGQQLRLRTQ